MIEPLHLAMKQAGTHIPFLGVRDDIYITSGIYLRFSYNILKMYNFDFPEDVEAWRVEVVYRMSHPGKIHYWKHTVNSPGHIREDSDVRDITKKQVRRKEKCMEYPRNYHY